MKRCNKYGKWAQMCLETHFQHEFWILDCFGQSGLQRKKGREQPLVPALWIWGVERKNILWMVLRATTNCWYSIYSKTKQNSQLFLPCCWDLNWIVKQQKSQNLHRVWQKFYWNHFWKYFNPNRHEAGRIYPLIIFALDFVSWIFIKYFQTFLEVKIQINRDNLTPCQAHWVL